MVIFSSKIFPPTWSTQGYTGEQCLSTPMPPARNNACMKIPEQSRRDERGRLSRIVIYQRE